jgi:hypothetical protein
MHEKRKILHECECFKPDIRTSFKNGKYSEEQIIECHGLQSLNENEEMEE